ncbi:MAG: DNA recombination protein RmuC, partial [Sodaliphilus sp.]|nr:DNA recombination protein RmuC [Sodaliphilus sp.]
EQVSYAAALKQQIKDLSDMNRNIGQEAKELTLALRGDSKVQGDWGEMVLKQILDMSGLQEGVNYETQMTREADGSVLKGEDGGRLRPDVVFFMPDNKRLVIDSKTSLTAYVEYVNAADEASRAEALRRHLASVRKHVDELANKKYQTIKDSADFVMMFVPNEPAYMLAMSGDASLWEYAYKRQVVMVSPTHLISVVKLISQLWARDRQSKNAIAIADEAGKMYDKLVGFLADMEQVGKAIDGAQKAHAEALKKLSEGKGNLIGRANKIKDLGAKATKLLPDPD